MNPSILKSLLKDYEHKKLLAEIECEKRKNLIYTKYKQLQKIDDELNSYAFSAIKNILSNDNSISTSSMQEKINLLNKEKERILKENNIIESDLLPHYECNICNDTGYILNSYPSTLCNCIKQKIFDIEYNKSNISNLGKENFNYFNINLYSDEINTEKYKSNISPRQNIINIKNIAENFIYNFNNPEEKNLVFTGNTGLGKTYLSNCIAYELLQKGKTVLYQTSSVMLDTILDYRFGKENTSNDIYKNILDVDLLIIDDLGTEYINSMKFTELFNIINTRLLNQHTHITKTIISTNLNLQNLFSTYDERIVSRIVGSYNICRFFGDDIRFQKNK